MDDYNSHMIVNFIVFYMKYLIYLFILFLHILHLLQLFDVNVFVLLKHVLAEEINIIFKFNFSHILCVNWISMFI